MVSFFSKLPAVLVMMLALTARAETAGIALTSAAADTASTAAALSSGLTELNPLGLAGTVVMKVATIAYINQLPEEDRAHPYSLASSLWGGATANNLCWLTGAGPLCFVVGLVTGRFLWNNGEEDRRFWAGCKIKRADNPDTPCARSDPDLNLMAEPVLAKAP